MPNDWTFRQEIRFTDSRPVLDVKYDIEKRVNRLLPRDPERPGGLVFRAYSKSYTSDGGTTAELRLEAAYETHNLYALQYDVDGSADPSKEKTWEENIGRMFTRWTSGLAITEDRAPSSPELYRQVVEETVAREFDWLITLIRMTTRRFAWFRTRFSKGCARASPFSPRIMKEERISSF